MASIANDLVVTCDKTEDIPESTSIFPSKEQIFSVFLLPIACLLLLVTIVVKYYIKRGLTNSCLLSY